VSHGHTTHQPAADVTDLRGIGPKLMPIGIVVGIVGVAASLGVAYTQGGEHKFQLFGLAYLGAFLFYLSLSLGGLFFTNIHHLTRAGWSTVVRRLFEVMAANLQLMALLAIPILVLVRSIYPWTAEHATEHFINGKAFWLSVPFFVTRVVIYLVLWVILARWYWRKSLAQDLTGDRGITDKLQAWSGLTVVIFAVTVSLAAFDLVMTLEPSWYSTMFAVYYFAGSMLAFFSFTVLVCRFLQKRGVLANTITVEHYHDLGKWMFAFTFFWGYIAYSQYMLIWYGNIPEETAWFAHRGASTNPEVPNGPWAWAAIVLLVGHLFIPFAALLTRKTKRRLGMLTFWAVWLCLAHFFDLYWVIMPELDVNLLAEQRSAGLSLAVMALAWIGLGGIYIAGLVKFANDRSLVPVRDPRLEESLLLENY
jgi:hypothetical protein